MNIKKQLSQYENALKLCNVIEDARFVGGCVRDAILGTNYRDVDLSTALPPPQIIKTLKANNIEYHDVGKQYGTIAAIINNQIVEITTLRTDNDCDGRYAKVAYTDSWQEDAQRRDFTINALCADKEGNVYDYVGGLEDIKKRIVRFIGDPEKRIQEDYLRILRFFRFSSFYAEKIDELGLKYCLKYANNLDRLSRERVKSELSKLFESPNKISTLKLMEPILKTIFKDRNNFVKDIEVIESFEQKFKFKVAPELFFTLWDKNHKLPLTRKQQQEVKIIATDIVCNWDYKALKQELMNHKQLTKEIILFNIIKQNRNLEDKLLTSDLEKLFSLNIEKLPISGKDLIALGYKAGEKIGKLLSKAESLWFEKEFKMTKEQILENINDDKH